MRHVLLVCEERSFSAKADAAFSLLLLFWSKVFRCLYKTLILSCKWFSCCEIKEERHWAVRFTVRRSLESFVSNWAIFEFLGVFRHLIIDESKITHKYCKSEAQPSNFTRGLFVSSLVWQMQITSQVVGFTIVVMNRRDTLFKKKNVSHGQKTI